jgi:ubiquinone biosynthesis protein UbiJ
MVEQLFLAALNHLLAGANWACARLQPFAGRQARIDMPPFAFAFEIDADGHVRPNPDPEGADVVIRLPADTPFLLPHGIAKIMAGANVEGNAEFATELSFVFRNLRWDAEEDLSKLFGDIAARRIVRGATGFLGWQKQLAENLAANVSEYLAQEQSLLVTAGEFNVHREDMVRLNAALTQLEKRLRI